MEGVSLLSMVKEEMNEGLDELEWQKIWYFRISKEVAGGGINNSVGWGTFSSRDLVEEPEIKMEVIA